MKIKQIIISCFISFSLFFILPKNIYAQTVFTDDFSNEYEKWQDVRDTFDLWSIISKSAKVFINTSSTLAEIVPKDIYWHESWKNYIYKLDYTYITGADKGLSFWFQDTLNWYQFHFVGNNYILSHIENGKEIWKQVGPLLLESGKTYNMELHLKDGNIKFFVDSIFQFEYFDPTFNTDYGKIGLKSGAGSVFPTEVHFDNISVSLIQSLQNMLSITPLKQTDPNWSSLEYDSAKQWAQNSFGIGDWGCLITSINMLMNYHGITMMPDGTIITPEVLNTWLNNQVDGYLGQGLVNWSAISRLVSEIHSLYGTPKFEYRRIPGDNLTSAISEIQNNKPVILETPGHFFVGNGFIETQDDLYITDPSYSYELLSQHEKELLSTRLLTPSFTDLSYIHIAHSDAISVNITNDSLNKLENHQEYSEFLTNASNTENSPKTILHEVEKPDSATYLLEIYSNSELPQPYNITIFTYDTSANVTDLRYSGVAGTQENPTIIKIHYNKEGESTNQINVSYSHLLKDIAQLKEKNEISKHYVAFELSQLVKAAQNTSEINKPRYTQAIHTTIEWYKNSISLEAQSILEQRLLEIQ